MPRFRSCLRLECFGSAIARSLSPIAFLAVVVATFAVSVIVRETANGSTAENTRADKRGYGKTQSSHVDAVAVQEHSLPATSWTTLRGKSETAFGMVEIESGKSDSTKAMAALTPAALLIEVAKLQQQGESEAASECATNVYVLTADHRRQWNDLECDQIDELLLYAAQGTSQDHEFGNRLAIAVSWWETRRQRGERTKTAASAIRAGELLLTRCLASTSSQPACFHDLVPRLFCLGLMAISTPCPPPTTFRTLADLAFLQNRTDSGCFIVELGCAALAESGHSAAAEIPRLCYLAGSQLIAEGRASAAEPFIEALCRDTQKESRGWGQLLLAQVAMCQGRLSDSREALSGAMTSLGMTPAVRATWTVWLMETGHFETATTELEALEAQLANATQIRGEERLWIVKTFRQANLLDLCLAEACFGNNDRYRAAMHLAALRGTQFEHVAELLAAKFAVEQKEVPAAERPTDNAAFQFPGRLELGLQFAELQPESGQTDRANYRSSPGDGRNGDGKNRPATTTFRSAWLLIGHVPPLPSRL